MRALGIEGSRYRKRRFIPLIASRFSFLLGVRVGVSGVTAALTRIDQSDVAAAALRHWGDSLR
jgi:hypothetical protein